MTPFRADPDALRPAGLTLARAASAAPEVWTGLTDDSRAVVPGAVFVARGSWSDQARAFVQDAAQRGAAALVVPAETPLDSLPDDIAVFTVPVVDQALAGKIADLWFDHPHRKLRLVGVTGTNGKTTVAMVIQHLLRASGLKCGLLGTIHTDVGDDAGPRSAELTTPGAIELRRLMAEMVAHRCDAVAMEVSSHALGQGRTAGLAFDAAVFTNLTQDHLDYHGSMDAYAAAKAKLFAQLKPNAWAVLNADDKNATRMIEGLDRIEVLWTSLEQEHDHEDQTPSQTACSSHCGIVRCIESHPDHTRARFDGPWGGTEATLPMIGRHNLSNALQAACATHALVPQTPRELRERLELTPPVPGRLEPVRRADGRGPVVLIDYAHTPDAIGRAASAVRAVTPGRLIVVYGCGGDRDRTKRPLMTAAALRHANQAVLTSDNPRSEDPQRIVEDAQVELSADMRSKLLVEIDRAAASRLAIHDANEGDAVLIAGKGHEDYQVIADPPGAFGGNTKKIHFDDREHARAALEQWSGSDVEAVGSPR